MSSPFVQLQLNISVLGLSSTGGSGANLLKSMIRQPKWAHPDDSSVLVLRPVPEPETPTACDPWFNGSRRINVFRRLPEKLIFPCYALPGPRMVVNRLLSSDRSSPTTLEQLQNLIHTSML
ncbi:hypothetical protein CIHG_09944 [Coccidioides immitis H538.4]|uniref:Uncharacterized protein n=1 Tax=Coccidioides immitis H538.4 TaxID=396776 RepID=A0A0J8S715_COCIT|nr:hypothetical protein CIHG_09944 [Coccidioides immitis H538.4]